ncbi:MAG: bifunctional UDP-sugar hydrolase/5'-nucleotidase [Verrucomicrobiota bacterium]
MNGLPSLMLPRRRFLKNLSLTAAVAAGLEPWAARAEAETKAGQVTVSIFNTTDLHGHILPTKTYEGVENVGGLARCATQIRQWRAEQPNGMLIDVGDVYQGTPVSRASDGQVMIGLLNKLNYDAWVIGNHEFDWGFDTVAKSITASKMPVLASNAKVGGSWTNKLDKTHPMSRVAPYLIKEVAGFRIGIVGTVTPGLPAWLSPGLLKDFYAADPLVSVQYAIRKLKAEKVDAIILACHFGLKNIYGGKPAPDDFANRVNQLTETCREIDVVIAGHTHKDFGNTTVNGIPYTQASYYGIHAGRVDLTFDTATRKLVGKQVSTKLMDASVEPDAAVLSSCARELEAARTLMSTEIGEFTAPLPFKGAPGQPPAALLLITRSIRAALEKRGQPIDGVLHGLFIDDHDLAAGRKTIADMWEIIPYENRLATAELSGAELVQVMEEVFSGKYASHQLDGFRVTAEGAKTKIKVTAIQTADGRPVDPGKRYRIALNAYDAQSGGRRYGKLNEFCYQKEANFTLHASESRDALIEYVTERKKISPGDLRPV